ncbi:transporter substrate-binding domain-containing protein [Brucella haematophila]|uniref:transporter substrate-binding domain-containing protein n=1 Tax=Brucella haematophila TaxID=419474 RepID=UPI000DE41FC1|nr:transporter substrate-binding domain-containing protein [Brucella haematophila]TMV04374.1 transporter substrate-binding domain-containing protein [Brucella haematophila]
MIKKSFAVFCGAAALITFSAVTTFADQLDEVKARGKIIVGIKNDYRPFGFLDKDAVLKGYEIDLAKQVAKKLLGSEDALEFVPVIASNRIELLNAGRIDLILATLGQNAERARVIDFTEAYYMMAGIELLGPQNMTVKSWDEVKGKKLCGVQGNLYNKTLTEKYGGETVLFTGTAEMFKAFQDGRCEAIAFDGPILRQKIADPEWAAKYKIALETFNYIPIAGGVRKNEEAFLKAVNDGILSAEANGVLVNAEKEFSMGESDYVKKRAADAKTAGF